MHASLEVNLPNYAGAIVTTDEIVAVLASLGGAEVASGRAKSVLNAEILAPI